MSTDNCPWISFDPSLWGCVASDAAVKTYRKHQCIFLPGQASGLYLVQSGRVRIELYSAQGDCKSLYIAEPGCLFGELSILSDQPPPCGATAAADSRVAHITCQRVRHELQFNMDFCRSILALMARKNALLCTQVGQLCFDDADRRVCSALLSLAQQHGTRDGQTCQLNVKFTHPEMGELVGLSRASVSAVITRLTAEGLLEKRQGHLFIHDITALAKRAGYLPE